MTEIKRNPTALPGSVLRDYIRNRPEFHEHAVKVDDGFTNSNFECPDFKRMMEVVTEGRTNCIILKDLSLRA